MSYQSNPNQQMETWEKIYGTLANIDSNAYEILVDIFWDGRVDQLLPGEYQHRAATIINIADEILNE